MLTALDDNEHNVWKERIIRNFTGTAYAGEWQYVGPDSTPNPYAAGADTVSGSVLQMHWY